MPGGTPRGRGTVTICSWIYVFIPVCLYVVTCLIACQRYSGNLCSDELISAVAPVVRYPLPLSGSRLLCMLLDRCLLMPVVLSSTLSPVCFLPWTPAVLDRVSAPQSPCLRDLLVCLRPSSYSPCLFHCYSNKRHSTCNWFSFCDSKSFEVYEMTVPICTSHWCLVMNLWFKVCI